MLCMLCCVYELVNKGMYAMLCFMVHWHILKNVHLYKHVSIVSVEY